MKMSSKWKMRVSPFRSASSDAWEDDYIDDDEYDEEEEDWLDDDDDYYNEKKDKTASVRIFVTHPGAIPRPLSPVLKKLS
jgi:hypothetical protein